ncbi:hypothetical protein K435DRAFT_804655 [Dendrothele bispora CBS 962.96]|uniref:Uncharacterized protein n=1 Tax=Dendrothele bispora (strain CBS 962.96) TaxID=1314807 RepID=A0A4S8LDH6_DENBC|nr:hypothetical protein K435DRAFT_804655 [Dendrothele bispora CBS 962.96]
MPTIQTKQYFPVNVDRAVAARIVGELKGILEVRHGGKSRRTVMISIVLFFRKLSQCTLAKASPMDILAAAAISQEQVPPLIHLSNKVTTLETAAALRFLASTRLLKIPEVNNSREESKQRLGTNHWTHLSLWTHFEGIWTHFEKFWTHLEGFWMHLEGFWTHFEGFWTHSGRILDVLDLIASKCVQCVQNVSKFFNELGCTLDALVYILNWDTVLAEIAIPKTLK